MKKDKNLAGIIAVVGWAALVLQFVIVLMRDVNQSLPVAERIVRYFSFFTILTNLIVAVATTSIAFFTETKIGGFFSKPSTRAAVAVYITIVGLVYSLFLRAVWEPAGWQAVADHLLHDAIPILYVVHWLLFAPKDRIEWTAPITWLVYPLAYVTYSLVRGAIVSWYPYWFVDVTKLGYASALTNTALVLIAFVGFGYVFTMIAKLSKRGGAALAAEEKVG